MFEKHCSDEQLLAFADGELGRGDRQLVRSHVEVCWECRARADELNAHTQHVARIALSDDFPGPSRLAAARHKIFQRVRALEAFPTPAPSLVPARTRIWTPIVAIAAAALLAVAGWMLFRDPEISAVDVLAKARRAEEALEVPVHQSFEIQIRNQDSETTATHKLLVWVDPGNQRFASKAVGAGGELRHAFWRPRGEDSFVYDRARQPRIVKQVIPRRAALWRQASRTDLTPAELEAAFLRWLEGQSWRPVLTAAAVAEFAAQEGVRLHVERASSPQGKSLVVRAEGLIAGRSIEVILSVDPVTFRPIVQIMRFRFGDDFVELNLKPIAASAIPLKHVETVFSRQWASASLFGGELSLPERARSREADIAPNVESKQPVQARPSAVKLATVEMEVQFALHRASACVGEPVRTRVIPDSHVEVEGLVETIERKQELAAILSELETSGWIRVHLRTISESVIEEEPAQNRTEQADQDNTPSDSSTIEMTTTASGRIPIELALQRYFEEATPNLAPGPQITQLANDALGLSENMMAQAWALRRLAEDFGGQRGAQRPQARWLLEVMLSEHLAVLRKQVAELRGMLDSPLRAITGGAVEQQASFARATDWSSAVLETFASIRRLHDSTAGLLARGDPTETVPDEAAKLLDEFRAFDQHATEVQRRLTAELRGTSGHLSTAARDRSMEGREN